MMAELTACIGYVETMSSCGAVGAAPDPWAAGVEMKTHLLTI